MAGAVFLMATAVMTGCGRSNGQKEEPAAETKGEDIFMSAEVSDETRDGDMEHAAGEEQIGEEKKGEEDGTGLKDSSADGYDELAAKYKDTAYEGEQMVWYVPREGQYLDFYFTDTVVSVEELGSLFPSLEGTHSIVHFTEAAHDFLVSDLQKKAQRLIEEEEWEKYDGLPRVYGTAPEEGITDEFKMNSVIETLAETGVEKDGYKYYVAEAENGIWNLLAVPEQKLLPDRYELYSFGSYDEEGYYNPTYGIRIAGEGIETKARNSASASQNAVGGMATEWGEAIRYSMDYASCPISIRTYEFSCEVTAEHVEKLKEEEFMDAEEKGTDEIGGKEYERWMYQDLSGEEAVVWYRSEENRIYTISANLWLFSTPEEILELIHPY